MLNRQAAPGIVAGSRNTDVVVRAENLRLRYPNGALGILDVSLEVGRGELIALLGANGAGKTSTVRAISGFVKTERARVVSGRVLLHGEEVTNREPHARARKGLFFIPERRSIFPNLRVIDNLLGLARLPKEPRRTELVEQVLTLFPALKPRLKDRAGALSGGQRQMLAIGRGLMAEPSVLVIDEMTLGLHHSLQVPLFSAVRQIADSGVAVILVDESAGLTREVADYCYVLAGGHVFDEGPPDKLGDREILLAGYLQV